MDKSKVMEKGKVAEKVKEKNKCILALADDIENRWQIMYSGDGLSQK
jgi:hypothetical protein